MDEVRVAIVGVGFSRHIALSLSNNQRGRVVALCDLLQDRMEEMAADLPGQVKLYSDFKEVARDPEVDAIFVGTPNQWHVPVALEAVKNDKHVMITKPLADSEEAARDLVSVAEAAGVVNMMSLSTRFSQEVRYLGQLIQQKDFGDLYYGRGRSVRRSGIPSWSRGFIEKGGGAFRDMGVHVLDAAWWLMGAPEPVSVTGVAGAKFGPRGQGFWRFSDPPEFYQSYAADDYAGGFVRFADGSGLQIESFWACHQADELQIELFGTEAGAKLRPLTLYRTVNGSPHDTVVNLPEPRPLPRSPKGATSPTVWDHLAEHFIAAILDGTECEAPLRHGLIVQEMMEGLLRSAETGQEVRLNSK